MSHSPKQVVIFGSPGTGKSYHVNNTILPELNIAPDGHNCISTVFHPEYSYGDFMGKLLPLTVGEKVNYRYHAGHFLKALSTAYKNILLGNNENVALVIDEINRGNSSAIFGTVFQLLDRNSEGWSDYDVSISDMEFNTIMTNIGVEVLQGQSSSPKDTKYLFQNKTYNKETIQDFIKSIKLNNYQIKLPPNFSIIATMNTSDSSIYYMDTAFKRRWEWQYIDIDSKLIRAEGIAFSNRKEWSIFVDKLNKFIRSNSRILRNADDKLIGYWFITDEKISKQQIQNKVMFYIWDGVLNSNKKTVSDLMGLNQEDLVVFGDFVKHVDLFIEKILALS